MAQRYDLRGRRSILSDSDTLVSAGLNVLQTDLARAQQVDHTVPRSFPVTSGVKRINTSSNNTTRASFGRPADGRTLEAYTCHSGAGRCSSSPKTCVGYSVSAWKCSVTGRCRTDNNVMNLRVNSSATVEDIIISLSYLHIRLDIVKATSKCCKLSLQ